MVTVQETIKLEKKTEQVCGETADLGLGSKVCRIFLLQKESERERGKLLLPPALQSLTGTECWRVDAGRRQRGVQPNACATRQTLVLHTCQGCNTLVHSSFLQAEVLNLLGRDLKLGSKVFMAKIR